MIYDGRQLQRLCRFRIDDLHTYQKRRTIEEVQFAATREIKLNILAKLFCFEHLKLCRFDEKAGVDTSWIVAVLEIGFVFGIRLTVGNCIGV